jgi:deoxycytidine triphosphate deaminase
MKQSSNGRLLAGESLLVTLRDGRAFADGTWSEECVRGSSYDVRLANDQLVVPGDSSGRRALVYGKGQKRSTEVMLSPGDTAFVSTMEHAQFAWDLAGILGAKFRLTTRGLLILNGAMVDPGYGLEESPDGSWIPMHDQRLYFLVANVGGEPLPLRPGDPIATLQLFKIESIRPERRRQLGSPGYDVFRSEYFEAGRGAEAGMVFFRNVRDALAKADSAMAQAEAVRTEARNLLVRVETLESGSKFVVTFGVYLVAVTFLGVGITLTLDVLAHFPSHPTIALVVGAIAGGAILFAGVCISMWAALRRLLGPGAP